MVSRSEIELGVVFPQMELGRDPGAVTAFVEAVRDIGYTHVVGFDHVVGSQGHEDVDGSFEDFDRCHEPLILFAYVAGMAPSLAFMPIGFNLPRRQTVLVAKQAAELDLLARGKLRMCVTVGWNAVEYEALGSSFDDRGLRIEEQVHLLRRLWTEPEVTFHGKYHKLSGVSVDPPPLQRPIPLWMGGSAPVALKRAARLADGFYGWKPLDQARGWEHTIEKLHEWRQEAGRGSSPFGFETTITLADKTPDQWLAEVERWTALGATHLALTGMLAGLSPSAHIALLERAFETLS